MYSNSSDCSAIEVQLSDFAQVTEIRWVLASVALLIMLISIIGNQMVFWTIINTPQLRTTTNWYILNLSAADFMVGTIVIPYRTLEMLADCPITSAVLSESVCPILRTVTNVCINVGINSVLFITIERYLAVVHPLAFQNRASGTLNVVLTVAAIWIISFVVILPEVMSEYTVKKVTMSGDYGSLSVAHCAPLSITVTGSLTYAIAHLVLAYMLPVVVVSASSVGIAYKFHRLTKTRDSQSIQSSNRSQNCVRRDESKRKITRTVCLIAILYTLSWTPYNIFKMLILFGGLQDTPHELFVTIICDLCSFAAAAVSPIILFTTSVSFRQAFTAFFSSTACYRKTIQRHTYSRTASKIVEPCTVSTM